MNSNEENTSGIDNGGSESDIKTEPEQAYNTYNESSNTYAWQPGGASAASGADDRNKKEDKKVRKEKRNGGFFRKLAVVIVLALIFGIVAGSASYGMHKGLGYFFGTGTQEETTGLIDQTDPEDETTPSGTDTAGITDVSSIVAEAMPSVVAITTTQTIDYNTFFPGLGENRSEEVESGSGSGIIIGKNETELLIITNNHVIDDSTSVYIQFVDGTKVDAVVKSARASEDLAVVAVPISSITEETFSHIKIATLATDAVVVGEPAIAIGNALGYGQSVTTGVISAVEREVRIDSLTLTLIQTDAAINPGNSGGALLNMKGEVIGINAAKYSNSQVEGMGFAIPISSKTDIIDELLNAETRNKVDDAQKGYLGIYGRDVSKDLSQTYNIPEGVYVVQVVEGGAAAAAGIRQSDVIVELDGHKVSSMDDLQEQLAYYESGEKVSVRIMTISENAYIEKVLEIELTSQIEE